MLDTGVLVPFENDAMLTIDSPFFVGGTDKVRPRRAPTIGEHSEQILREIGYDEIAIAKLRESRIVA
jgi:crotonobetainyl-CoA:carnitine CoA-transferase CaiB-like acyl-CoA transferase